MTGTDPGYSDARLSQCHIRCAAVTVPVEALSHRPTELPAAGSRDTPRPQTAGHPSGNSDCRRTRRWRRRISSCGDKPALRLVRGAGLVETWASDRWGRMDTAPAQPRSTARPVVFACGGQGLAASDGCDPGRRCCIADPKSEALAGRSLWTRQPVGGLDTALPCLLPGPQRAGLNACQG